MSTTAAPTPETFTMPARWATEPFVMGSSEQFARLRSWFREIGYTEPQLCTAANVPWLGKLTALEGGRKVFRDPVDAQSLLVLLFLDGLQFPWETVRGVLPPDDLSKLTDLGLLQPAMANRDNCIATVALFPYENLYVVSDRLTSGEVIGDGSPPDLVYTPLTQDSKNFVEMMPRVPCADYLEVCAGTGIAALLAATQFAGRAYSADITERSTRFASFNAALNGIENFTAVQGDLYAPVAGKQFDIISAHPPYVPAESTEMVYRDGGADGEQITRRVVAGVATCLKPGGLFYLDCMMTDRVGDPTEQRLRRMLGPAEDEFDVVVFRRGIIAAKQYHANQLAAGRLRPEAFVRQREWFTRVGIEDLVAVQVLIQRRLSPRAVVTRHQTLGDQTTADDLLWLVRYASGTVEWGPDEIHRLLDARPRAIPGTELRMDLVLKDGDWSRVTTKIGTNRPFGTSVPCPPWFPDLLRRCNGQLTARDHLARLREEGAVPPSKSDDDFAQLIRELADVPLLELDEYPLPKIETQK